MRSLVTTLALLIGVAAPLSLSAQQRDTVRSPAVRPKPATPRRPAPPPIAPDSELQPPISPRRAFLSSLAIPGLGQTRLARGNAAAFFVGIEAISIAMARKAANDLREARLYQNHLQIGEFTLDANYHIIIDTTTGQPTGTAVYSRLGNVGDTLVKARRTHYEDWIAAILFNHLISGADAYVAAHLWDLPTQVQLRAIPRGAVLGATVWW